MGSSSWINLIQQGEIRTK